MKKCPMCAEEIKDEAVKCKHCGTEFVKSSDQREQNTTVVNVKSGPNYCLWGGGCCLLIILSPILLPLLGLGGMAFFVVLLYVFPAIIGGFIAYIINWHTNIKDKKKIAIIVAVVGVVLSVIWISIVLISSNLSNNSEFTSNTVKKPSTISPSENETNNLVPTENNNDTVMNEVELINYEELKLVENYDYLLLTEDKSEENITRIAQGVKEIKCKKDCNITLFDDKSAYDLNEDEINYVGPELEQWNREHYVFVADHLVGFLDFETGQVDYYPLRDWLYEDIKAGRY